jgi:hypothetical protein
MRPRFERPDFNSKHFDPIILPIEADHKGFPQTCSQVCGMDVARDKAQIFDNKLKRWGTILARLDLYLRLLYVFWHPFQQHPQSKAWEKDTMDDVAWLLRS